MSKMGALNLEIEEWVYASISNGKTFDATVDSTQSHFRMSDADAERIVWDIWCEYNGREDEPVDSFDLSDDADALASAGFGTDEDYGGDFERI